jgi:hypothetical protein
MVLLVHGTVVLLWFGDIAWPAVIRDTISRGLKEREVV